MSPSIIVQALLVAGVALAVWGCKTSRSGYESAPYSVILSDGDCELRDYPELAIVRTGMPDSGGDGSNAGFGKLFRYISGNNKTRESIAMTTPVFISQEPRTMAFVLPAKSSFEDAPAPLDSSLRLEKIPAGRFAVLRFGGTRSATKESEALALLKNWLAEKGLASAESPVFGYFDPPWTPSFLRRNEVMLRITPKPATDRQMQAVE
jgi:DNA gyrase inhibitor GyrI